MPRLPLPRSRAGRALLAFWAVVLLSCAGIGGTLQWLGPPRSRPANQAASVPAPRRAADLGPRLAAGPAAAAVSRLAAARFDIAPPDAARLQPAPGDPGHLRPSLAPEGRPTNLAPEGRSTNPAPEGRQAGMLYAARLPVVPAGSDRVAILLSGVGLSASDSLDAVDRLPAAVTLTVSPYAEQPAAVLDAARRAGHELLLSLPMDPARSPLDDEGAQALTEQVDPDENARRLQWSLSRLQAYAGVTNAAGALGGEAFAGSAQFPAVVQALARRGLFYLDATPDSAMPTGIAGAKADLRLDDPPSAVNIDRQLAALEQIAHSRGSAIGAAGPLFPVTIQRLADWIRALPSRGLVLVPVSSLVRPPARLLAGGMPGNDP